MPRIYGKRTDKGQAAIVEELRKRGVQVILTSALGNNFPDLLCGYSGRWILMEVKGDGCLDRGQLEFLRDARGPVAVVTNAEEAHAALINGIDPQQQQIIAAWLLRNPEQKNLRLNKFRKVLSGEI